MPDDKGNRVFITDVTLREYGQNVPLNYLNIFTPQIRVETALALVDPGFPSVEVLSWVHQKVAPAMNKKVLAEITTGLGRIRNANLITLEKEGMGVGSR